MRRNNTVNQNRRIITAIFILVLTIFLTQIIISVSFTNNPIIDPLTDKRPDTNDTLTCAWNSSGDTTQQNVSWHKDGVSFKNETDLLVSYSAINPENTSREENWNCTVIITNGTDTTTQSNNVTIKNAQPTIPTMTNSTGQDMGNTTTVTEDLANVFNLSSTDPDSDAVTYGNLGSLPSGSSLNQNTGVFTWTPIYTQNDTNITFYATDSYGSNPGITSKKVLFSLIYVNDAPTFNPALANQIINESQVLNYRVSGTDEENNIPFNFSVSVTPNLSLIANITNSTSAIIMFENNRTASYSEAGNYTVNVTVYDNQSASTTSSFNLNIRQVNLDPVLRVITTQNGTQGQNFSFYVYADDGDVNNTLNFSITPTACTITNPWSISAVNSSHNATGLVNITPLNNNHVICRNVRIIVIDDVGAEDYQDVFLNISNTNDPPNVEVLSSSLNNTDGNNISDQLAYAESTYAYRVNVTDPDSSTYEGEVFTYSDNATLFDINSSTGLIIFTPAQLDADNHTINITVSDDGGLSDSEVMNLEIRNNSAPVLASIGNITCLEDTLCFAIINATDLDNDSLNFTSNNTAVFNLTNNNSQNPVWSAYINYTPNQSLVGNYSIVITVTDIRGAIDNETIFFTINNTNDAPQIQTITLPAMVETHSVSVYVQAEDEDYSLPSAYNYINVSGTLVPEYVTFNNTNLSGANLFNISTYFNSSNSKTYARILFTPQLGDAGNYSVNISAADNKGVTDYEIKNFTVIPKSNPPNITQIMPYGLPYSAGTVFDEFTNTSNYAESLTSIDFYEDQSVFYNISVTDDMTALENITYEWYINGAFVGNENNINIIYNFFSSGYYNVTVRVYDDMYENSSWTWNVTVRDNNRNPLFLNSLPALTVNSTTVYTDFLKQTVHVHFIDPDDDLNSNQAYDEGEASHLSYTVGTCEVATLLINNDTLRVIPLQIGTCSVFFTGMDSDSASNTSNTIVINVTAVPNSTEEVPTPSSGGGGGRSRSIVVPLTKQESKPQAIELIVPEMVTIYENRTVHIPVTLQNNWNDTLREISLNASSNASFIRLKFTDDFFKEILPGEKKHTTLVVDGYRMGENYEIRMTGNVASPNTSDSATVLLNTIEQAESGENVQTKVTFAQDLLNANPECLELNELLTKAKEKLSEGSNAEASRMVDGVINGCKYLVSISKKSEQNPQSIITKIIRKENAKFFFIFAGIAGIALASLFIIKNQRITKAKKEAEEKAKEAEVKPYIPST